MEENKKKGFFRESITKGFPTFLALAGTVLVVFVIYDWDSITSTINKILGILTPIILGVVLAYLINPMVVFYENGLTNFYVKHFAKKPCIQDKNEEELKEECKEKKISMRMPAIFITLVIVIAVITLLLFMVIPQIYTSVISLKDILPGQIKDVTEKLDSLVRKNKELETIANQFYGEGIDFVTGWIKTNLLGQVSLIINGIMAFFSGALNVLIGVIVAIYVLSSKETFARQFNKLIKAFFSEKQSAVIVDVLKESNKIFGGFISGKLVDSLIMGILCLIGCRILSIPYYVLISVIIGVTNIIPFFGPYIGVIPSAIIVLLDNPSKGIIFIIFIAILQQIDGNIIGPKILGESTGLSPFWVVFAILMGGGLFGLIGMLIGVPTFGVIYYLIKTYVNYRLEKKKVNIDETK